MEVTIRTVRLPNGKKAVEHEQKYYGGSETQVTYDYYRHGLLVNKNKFRLDYWGRIENIEIID